MGFYESIANMSDEQIEACLGEKFVEAAKVLGVTTRECVKMIIPDELLPLNKSEIEYGNKLAKEIMKKLELDKNK